MASLSNNAVLAERAVTLLGERDLDGLKAMFAPDVRAEAPFHPAGPTEFNDTDSVVRNFRQLRGFDTFRIDIVQTFDTGGDTVIVEGRSVGTHKDASRPVYNNHYLFVLSFEDGKLTCWREFFNPLEAIKQGYGAPAAG